MWPFDDAAHWERLRTPRSGGPRDDALGHATPTMDDMRIKRDLHQGVHQGSLRTPLGHEREQLSRDDSQIDEPQSKRRRLTRGQRGGKNRRRDAPLPMPTHTPLTRPHALTHNRTAPDTAHASPGAAHLTDRLPGAVRPTPGAVRPTTGAVRPTPGAVRPTNRTDPSTPQQLAQLQSTTPLPLTYNEVVTVPAAISRKFIHHGLAGDVAAAQLITQLGDLILYDT